MIQERSACRFAYGTPDKRSKVRHIAVRLSEETISALREESYRTGRSLSGIIREMVVTSLAKGVGHE